MNHRNMTNDELLQVVDDLNGHMRPEYVTELAKRLAAAMGDLGREACPFELVAEKHGIGSSAELDALLARVPE